jgi:hypothetical protein
MKKLKHYKTLSLDVQNTFDLYLLKCLNTPNKCFTMFYIHSRQQSRWINHDQIKTIDMVLESFEKNYMKCSCFAHLVTFWKVTKFQKLQDNVVLDF